MKHVYLAGPIAGLTYDQAIGWRNRMKNQLPTACYDPLHGVLPWEGVLQGSTLEQSVLTTPRGVVSADYYYTTNSQLIVANFATAVRPSFGTVIECAWAFQARIPIVGILDDIHDHTMLREMMDFIVKDEDETVWVVRKVLQS